MIPWGGVGVAVERFEDRVVVAMANGTFSGFDTDYRELADPLLPRLIAAAPGGKGALEETILAALCATPSEWQELDGELPSLQFLVACARESSVELSWIGGGIAQHVRGEQVIATSRAHVIGNDPGQEGKEWPGYMLAIATRGATKHEAKVDSVTWRVEPGDRVIICDHLGIIRAGWLPPPAEWPEEIIASDVAYRAREAHRTLEFIGAVGGKPKFAGVFAMLAW